MGYLPPEQVDRLRNVVDNFESNVPVWMLNRRKDVYTGENRHLIGIDVTLGVNEDVNLMKKMRSYKGIRHERGQKVRARGSIDRQDRSDRGVVRKSRTRRRSRNGRSEELMGYQVRQRNIRHSQSPWQKARIDEETGIVKKYGLRNKKAYEIRIRAEEVPWQRQDAARCHGRQPADDSHYIRDADAIVRKLRNSEC
jgi:ribosomal protein S13